MAAALYAIVRTFVLYLTLGRIDGGYDLKFLLPSRRNKQPPSLEGEKIIDAEPEDMYNDESFWAGLGVGVSTAQPGDSSKSLAPDPLPQGPRSEYLALVLEVVPDVLPEHAMELVKKRHLPYGDEVVNAVVQGLLDDPSYPKAKINFASVDRPKPTGEAYRTLALNQLSTDFPRVSVSHIRDALDSNNGLYVPTHIQLTGRKESGVLPLMIKAVKAKIPMGKGKGKEAKDKDFEEERAWLLLRGDPVAEVGGSLQNQAQEDTGTSLEELLVSPEEEAGLECGCCFSPAPFHEMIQCSEGHLFCLECMVAYASNLLGERNFKIVCMDQSGCSQPFPESELKRFLTPNLLSLYWKVRQAKEVEMAALDGLEECSQCEYKAVMDNRWERVFMCQTKECGAVTCRDCKKPDHRPKPCTDVDEDKKIDAYHVVEEAMTNALLRSCPNCNRKFVKEQGCNTMSCPNCRTHSCYVCRERIDDQYGHFTSSGTCQLYDTVDIGEKHRKEVKEAQNKAVAASEGSVQGWVKLHFNSPGA